MATFIWDLDGTLLESYEAILAALEVTYHHYSWEFDRPMIHHYILEHSVGELLQEMADFHQLTFSELKQFYSEALKQRDDELELMDGAREILEWTKANAINNFMYTHKGDNAHHVLKQLNIADYFEEVITGDSGFKRKPHPEALEYLIDKYQLDRKDVFYIGDRRLDHELALNAKVNSINLVKQQVDQYEKIDHLLDIKHLTL